MKKILLLIVAAFSVICADAAQWGKLDTLQAEIDPNLTQRGVLLPDWKETAQYFNKGMIKYQVIIDKITNESFAIVNQVDTALYGKVEVPQYVKSDSGEELKVKGLGLYAFYLGHVSELYLPESVEYIGDCAFFRCYDLKKLDMPDKVHTIGNCAFTYTALDTLVLPDKLTSLGEFSNLTLWADKPKQFQNLKCLRVGSLLEINNHRSMLDIFYFPKLEKIEVSPDNKYHFSVDGVVYDKKDGCLTFYPEGKTDALFKMPEGTKGPKDEEGIIHVHYIQALHIAESVDSIKSVILNDLFDVLHTIVFPSGLKYIKRFCYTCYGLKHIYSTNPTPPECGEDIVEIIKRFLSPDEFASLTLYVPRGSSEQYSSHPIWGKFKNIVEFDEIDYRINTSSTPELESNSAQISVEGNKVRIISDDVREPAYIFDTQGRMLASGREREFTINAKGLFIVKFKNITKKFVVQ